MSAHKLIPVVLAILIIGFSNLDASASPTVDYSTGNTPKVPNYSWSDFSGENTPKILLAKKKRKRRSRAKRLTGEKSFKSGAGSSTKIDFDAIDISGQRKTPLGSLVTQSKASLEYDFVKIRLRWHPEMVQSAASLESGGK